MAKRSKSMRCGKTTLPKGTRGKPIFTAPDKPGYRKNGFKIDQSGNIVQLYAKLDKEGKDCR